MRVMLAALLLVPFPAGSARAQDATPDRAKVIAAARDVMQAARFATLITIGEDGHPQARIVDPAPPGDGLVVWVGTNPKTRKVRQIARDARVTLLYFDAAGLGYVTLLGRAEPVTDPDARRREWREDWAPFYPGGPLDEGFLLLRIRPHRLEISSLRHGLVNDPVTWRPVVLDLP